MLQDLARQLHISRTLFDILAAIVIVLTGLILGLILRRVLRRFAGRVQNTWGELLFSLFEPLPVPLLLLAALYTALENLKLPNRWEHLGSQLIFALVLLIVFYFPAKVFVLFLRRLGQKQPGLERITQPAISVVRVLFALVAIIIFLENLGIRLTAVWTTLGVGSVAVALALQDTLGNFFAGLYLIADRPISQGDYIKLDADHEGFVVRTGWRSTLLRTTANNLVVVPNSTLAKATIINYSMPEDRMVATVQVSVAYGSDPRRVERLLVEIGEEAASDTGEGQAPGNDKDRVDGPVDGLLLLPKPVALLVPGFGASSLDFTLVVHVRRFTDQGGVQSELRKRILDRFRQEDIEMPFPTQRILISRPPTDSARSESRQTARLPSANHKDE